MSQPRISIIIPAYKAREFIEPTLGSVRAQTFQEWELLVIEDGTDDGTRGIIENFSRTNAQAVRYLRHAANRGLPSTRNTGIEAAQGEWIALLDADDLWTPAHLSNLWTLARQSGADLIHSGVQLFDSESGRHLEVREPSKEAQALLPLSLFDGRYPIQPSSTLIRRELLVRAGSFDPLITYVEDRECWIRLARAGIRIAFHPERSCLYRQHASAMTRNAERMSVGMAMVYQKHGDWEQIPAKLRKKLASEAWLSAARIVLRTQPGKACSHLKKALTWKPLSPRLWIYWLLARTLSLKSPKPTP